jgi:hypothetical protein
MQLHSYYAAVLLGIVRRMFDMHDVLGVAALLPSGDLLSLYDILFFFFNWLLQSLSDLGLP